MLGGTPPSVGEPHGTLDNSWNVASQSPLNTRVRIWHRRGAPRGVHGICWRMQKGLLST
jgi:hypothetical protein